MIRRAGSRGALFVLALAAVLPAASESAVSAFSLAGQDRPVVLVTGSTSGLGREVARRIATSGAHVIVHGRNRERGMALVEEIERDGKGSARFYAADLASFDQVRAFGEAILRDYERLDVLVNNAGFGSAPDERLLSEDGHEFRFQVNYLSSVLLTQMLLPLLLESTPSRIVNVSSLAQTPIDFDDVMIANNFSGGRAYAQSKLAQIMFTFDLAEELRGRDVMVNALHPATYMPTGMVQRLGVEPRATIAEGADAVMQLVSSNEIEGGQFFNGLKPARANDQAYDESARARLRRLTEELIASPTSQYEDPEDDPNYLGTFSIIARDPATGELGMGVQSKAFGAGNRAMHAKGGLVIVAHQAAANPMYGAIGIELLQAGYSPQEALDIMVASDEGRDRRQVSILDSQGRTAAFTGQGANDWKGHTCGTNYCAQGNILTGPEVVAAMSRSFENSSGPLVERLMDALDAAQAAGGDARGMQSGALLVVSPRAGGGYSDRAVDIRVDDHTKPLEEMRRVMDVFRSGQMIREAGQKREDGDVDGALEIALAARDRSPGNDNAWVALAEIYVELNRKADAFSALERALELNPSRARTLPADQDFEAIHNDPDFLRLIGRR